MPSTVFYDVGANAGFFSLLVARHLGPDGLILAIDPLPENVNAISEVARVNRQDHIEVIAKAIASEEGEAELVDGGHSSTARLSSSSKSAGLPQNTMRVETTSLDQLSDVYPDPTVVKIDVEGAELDVLRGAQKVLGRARPVLFLELHDGVSRHEVHDILRSFSYTVSDLSGRAIDILAASPARHVLAQPSIQRTS